MLSETNCVGVSASSDGHRAFAKHAYLVLCQILFVVVIGPARLLAEDLPPKPRDKEEHWVKRHAEYVAEAKKAAYDVLFVGDSITFCWRWEGQGKEPYVKHFPDLAPKTRFFGIPGDGVQNLRWRLQNGEFEGQQPKVVCLLIGINNLGAPQAAIVEGVKKNVELIQSLSPKSKIILHGIFPTGEKPSPARDAIKAINKEIGKFADGKKVVFLDIGDKFLERDGTISKEMMSDFVHLTAKGYEIWASELEKPLRELLK
jgi:lysophospholipase L1-like esterase